MKIVIDSGATKSDWRLIRPDGSVRQMLADGINASTMSVSTARNFISGIKDQISEAESCASEIYLYMAGIPSEEMTGAFREEFGKIFPDAVLRIEDDLIGAARAAFGHSSGIVAILGTGSNSCMFDGERIVSRVRSGGYILGDEGSAACLGKTFISDFLKGLIPEDIAGEFSSRFPSDYQTIVKNTYQPVGSPSGYLGSFAPFIVSHYGNEYIRKMIEDNFRSFIRRSLKQYDTKRLQTCVIGGFGYSLKEIFTKVAEEEGISISGFIKSPMDRLTEYHRQDKQ